MECAKRAAIAAGIIASLAIAEPASAARFDIAPGPLGTVAAAIGARAGISIGVADPVLAMRASPGVNGNLSLTAALRRALQGTGAAFAMIDKSAVAIVAARPAAQRGHPRPRPLASPIVAAHDGSDVVVIASKQATRLDRYPGSAEVLNLVTGRLAMAATGDTAAIVATLPTLASTSLGSGRDKLFIRGVADSSFNGPSQSTIGQYLGEARLTYNAPDPALNLYDMQRVEVLVGPQGTLYGSGSLGGILRLIPNAPDLSEFSSTAAAGGSATRFGGTGGDMAAMANIPVGGGHAAVRAVGFWREDAGYIDDPGRRLSDINRTTSYGGRLTLRVVDLADWTIDAGAALQNIASHDGQYTLRGQPPLTRRSSIAQPFYNDFRIGFVTARRALEWAEVVSTTSVVRHDVATVFDASAASEPRRFFEDIDITLISHETRIAGGTTSSWVGGFGAVYDLSRLSRTLGTLDAPLPIAGVRNEHSEYAVFGRYAIPLLPGVAATVGGRVTYARSVGNLLERPNDDATELKRSDVRVSPTLALAWTVSHSLFAFAHYQEGFRAAGLAVAPSGSIADSRRIDSDHLTMVEAGLRRGREGRDRLTFGLTLSHVVWSDIQADLVDLTGLPFTANVGTGRIVGLEARMGWRIGNTVDLEASGFLNDSKLFEPAPEFLNAVDRKLPNIFEKGGRIAAKWRVRLPAGADLVIDGSLRYVGSSQLGIGAPLDVEQGNYLVGAVGGRVGVGRFAVSLDVANLADARGNRFAFGNPFGIAARDQMTPLRPRTIRIGIDERF